MPAPNGEFPPIEVLRHFFRVDEHSRLERRMAGGGWRLAAKKRKGTEYFAVGFQGKQYGAHRIIWALHHGRAPAGLIDHINGQPWDNRIDNLREVSYQQNRWNSKNTRANRTGYSNVREADGGGYQAYVTVNYQMHTSPVFDDAELAGLAAVEMARRLHGEFAYVAREAA